MRCSDQYDKECDRSPAIQPAWCSRVAAQPQALSSARTPRQPEGSTPGQPLAAEMDPDEHVQAVGHHVGILSRNPKTWVPITPVSVKDVFAWMELWERGDIGQGAFGTLEKGIRAATRAPRKAGACFIPAPDLEQFGGDPGEWMLSILSDHPSLAIGSTQAITCVFDVWGLAFTTKNNQRLELWGWTMPTDQPWNQAKTVSLLIQPVSRQLPCSDYGQASNMLAHLCGYQPPYKKAMGGTPGPVMSVGMHDSMHPSDTAGPAIGGLRRPANRVAMILENEPDTSDSEPYELEEADYPEFQEDHGNEGGWGDWPPPLTVGAGIYIQISS